MKRRSTNLIQFGVKREFIDLIEGKIKLTQFDENLRINRTNMSVGITRMVLTLDKLGNTNNLEKGKPSSSLLTYHVTDYDDSMHFEPCVLQYKKLKNGGIVPLPFRITHMKNSIMTDGPATTVVLYI